MNTMVDVGLQVGNSIGKSVFDLLIQLYGVENFVSMNKEKNHLESCTDKIKAT